MFFEEGICYDPLVCSLGKALLAFALLHSVLQGQICLLLQMFLDFLLFHSSPLYEKDIFLGVLVLKGLVGLLSNLLKEQGQIILEVEVFYKLISN